MDVIVQTVRQVVEVVEGSETPVEIQSVRQTVEVTAPGPQGVPGDSMIWTGVNGW